MADEPDLMAELDDAERIVSGEAEKIVTEWGVRWDDEAGWHAASVNEYGLAGKQGARRAAARLAHDFGCTVTLVSRKVTYGAWEDSP